MAIARLDAGARVVGLEQRAAEHGEHAPANVPDRPGMIYADPETEQMAFHLADVFGARRVLALGTFDCRPVGPDVIDAFAALCDRAASHSMQVALEFTPYSNIPDARTASQIVAAAHRPNGGICIDAWHFFRGSADFDDLAAVDLAKTFMIQFNDGPATPIDPDLRADAIHNRRCPGQGDFDLERFLRTLDQPGLDLPVSVATFDHRLHRQTTSAAVHAAAASTCEGLRVVTRASRSDVPVGSAPGGERPATMRVVSASGSTCPSRTRPRARTVLTGAGHAGIGALPSRDVRPPRHPRLARVGQIRLPEPDLAWF